MPDESIGQKHDGIAIAIGQFKGQRREIRHLLRRMRGQNDGAIVAVATALDHLVVIALLGCDVAQSWPAASNVGNYAGQFRAGHITDAFLHQTDPGPA